MKIRIIGIYILIMMTSFVYSQNDKIINLPQSATVASLESYQKSSINYSTGDLKLEIPIFTIKTDDFEFPIKLYYDYKGYNPMDMPTQVGYGWNIQDTGFISVNVRGVGDFKENGYVFGKIGQSMIKPLLNGEYANDNVVTSNILACIRDFGCDGEPDKYNILLPKLNSSFYINEEGNTYTVPKDQNKIFYDLNSNFPNFKVLDSDGNLYKFEEAENFINKDCTNYLNLSDVKNSYCLTQIITNKNKVINYSYETKKIQYKSIDEDLYDYSENYQNGGCNLNASPSPRFCYEIDTKYIKQISYSNSLVEFSYEDRDVFTSLLKEIKIKNSFGTLISKFIFYYNTDNQLIKIEKNNDVETIILNEFEYFGTRQKINNSSFKPEGLYNYQLNLSSLKNSTNSRANKFKADLNGALKKISYPTKGFSEFSYEPNMATNNIYNTSIQYWNDDSVYNTNESCNSTENESSSKIINIPYDQIIKVVVSTSAPGTTGISEADAHAGFDKLDDIVKFAYSSLQLGPDFNVSIIDIVLRANSYHEGSNIRSNVGGGTSLLYVLAGNYTCTTNTSWSSGSKPRASVTVSYNTEQPLNFYVSGFRLSSVKKYDLTNNFEQINYNYNDETGRSSALIKKPGITNYRLVKQCNPTIENGVSFYPENSNAFNFAFINSKFLSPNLGSTPVLYRLVTEEFVNSAHISNGKIKYRFVSNPDHFLMAYNSFLGSNIPKVDIDNLGALSEKIIYDASGAIVESYSCHYSLSSYNTPNIAYGLPVFCKEIFMRETWPITSFELLMGIRSIIDRSLLEKTHYMMKPYILNNSNYLKLDETTINDFKNGIVINTEKYVYNENSGQLRSKSSTNSENEILETKYSYPQDLQNEPYVNDLILKNIIGTPIKIETFKNGIKLSEQKTEFIKTTEDLLLPKFMYNKKGEADIDKNLDKKITYDLYDDKGNILQYTPNGATSTSIIWGYNKTQPIAKIDNITYDQIASYVSNLQSLSDVDDDNCLSGNCKEQILRNALNSFRNSFPQNMVSTYTYNPLVGVTSITDAKGTPSYYDYDTFGRLKFVKDKDLNVLQKYCYNYKGQLTDCGDNSSTSIILYRSAARTGSFTKNNCAIGGVGSKVDYILPEGAVISTTSQADADSQALLKLNDEGQTYANTDPSVKCTFKNNVQNRLITRNNCSAGGSPASVWYTVAAGIYSSNVSQAAADAQAQSEIDNNGQAFANNDANAKCTFKNTAQSRLIARNNCDAGGSPASVLYTVTAGIYNSNVSQAAADAQAYSEIDLNGQAYANNNANAKCTFYSIARSGSFTKNNCAVGTYGSNVPFSQAAGAVTSTSSQTDADTRGLAKFNTEGMANANATGICILPLPASPIGLTLTNAAATSLNFSWTAVAGATSYKIYKNGSDTGVISSTTTGSLSGLTTSTTYSIQVVAVNASGNSDLSMAVSMTTASSAITNSCTLNFNRVSGSYSMYKNGSKYLTASTSGISSGTLTTGDTFYVVLTASATYYKTITITSSVRGILYDYGPSKGNGAVTSLTFTKVGSEVIAINCTTSDML